MPSTNLELYVALFFNDQLVDERHLRSPDLVTVGEHPGATFQVADACVSEAPVLAFDACGPLLYLNEPLAGAVMLSGARHSLGSTFSQEASLLALDDEHTVCRLGSEDRGVLRVATGSDDDSGGANIWLAFSVQRRQPSRLRNAAVALSRWPRTLATAFAASLVLQGIIVFAAFWIMPPRTAAVAAAEGPERAVEYSAAASETAEPDTAPPWIAVRESQRHSVSAAVSGAAGLRP